METIRPPLWIVATACIVVGLYFFREPLSQFTLALILWLAIAALSRFLSRRIRVLPEWLALPLAIVVVLGLTAVVVIVVTQNLGAFAGDVTVYQQRLDAIARDIHTALGLSGAPPTIGSMVAGSDPRAVLQEVVGTIQGVAADTLFILIFLAFILSAADSFPKKLDRIFGGGREREEARAVFTAIRESMENYLLVQTVLSLITCALTYATFLVIGLDNPIFWTFLIFFLNFIPTIGSIIAVALPTAFALIQFSTFGPVVATFAGVGVWQFLIGNFVAPRMTGHSLNLSAVVVLLTLSIWSVIWGIAGAFLAAPLTVMIMIVLAQFKSTRWISIMLSADGKPTRYVARDGVVKDEAAPEAGAAEA